ncbi:MAG: 4-hydroxybenzoate octaprenyltransferase [Desulfovibrio sp.]
MHPYARDFLAVCRMIKIEHSIFALPFAYAGLFLGAGGWPGFKLLFLVTIAMVTVRSFAMGINRVVDLDIDKQNPRTKDRPLVTGEISPQFTRIFCAIMAVLFLFTCAFINKAVFVMAPFALIWSGFYSVTKRFTWLCHFVLGSVLGIAPLAGWLSASPTLAITPVCFLLGVTFWVAGFDIMYSCQDRVFDREHNLNSIPANFGIKTSLALAAFCHVVTPIFFILAGWAAGLGFIYLLIMLAVGGILIWEHRLVSPDDMSRVNMAFFNLNGIIAVVLLVGVLVDLFM